MKKIFFIPIFLLLACTSKEVKIPADIISKEKMVDLFVDIHLADGLVVTQKLKDAKVTNQLKKSYLQSVLKNHEISLADYEKSLAFYEKNEALMVEVYEEVMIKFSEEQALLEGDKEEKPKDKKKEEPKK